MKILGIFAALMAFQFLAACASEPTNYSAIQQNADKAQQSLDQQSAPKQ